MYMVCGKSRILLINHFNIHVLIDLYITGCCFILFYFSVMVIFQLELIDYIKILIV